MQQVGWVAIAAIVVGALVRLAKTDALGDLLAKFGLPAIPKKALPWIALALGCASSILDVKLQGTDWPTAVMKGLLAGIGAVAGHQLVIESILDGKEIGKDGGPPAAGGAILLLLACAAGVSCTKQDAKNAAGIGLDAAQIACAIAHAESDDPSVAAICRIEDALAPALHELLKSHRRMAAAKCPASDGGDR